MTRRGGLAVAGALLAATAVGSAAPAAAVLGLGNPSAGATVVTFLEDTNPQVACTLQISVVADPEFSNALTINGTTECNLPATVQSQYVVVRDRLDARQTTGPIYGTSGTRGFYALMVATPNFGANGDRLGSYCARITFGGVTKSACATTPVAF